MFSLQSARALAVAQPIPSNVTLKRGESLPFRFNVQAMTSKQDQLCTYSMSGMNSLIVTFEKGEVVVEAGKKLDVLGTLEVPRSAPFKDYEGELIVSCRPNIEASGVSLITQSTRFPFLVKVIKSEEGEEFDWKFLLIPVLVVIIVSLVLFKLRYRLKPRGKREDDY